MRWFKRFERRKVEDKTITTGKKWEKVCAGTVCLREGRRHLEEGGGLLHQCKKETKETGSFSHVGGGEKESL